MNADVALAARVITGGAFFLNSTVLGGLLAHLAYI